MQRSKDGFFFAINEMFFLAPKEEHEKKEWSGSIL